MITINGRNYPLWSQFIERKEEWIGGLLIDLDDYSDHIPTEITDIILVSNGKDSAWFQFSGKEFDCGFDVQFAGVSGKKYEDYSLVFHGQFTHFAVKRRAIV